MFKNTNIWLGNYLVGGIFLKNKLSRIEPIHIMLCLVDHFEPQWERPSYHVEVKRVDEWTTRYPKIAQKFKDSDGKFPQHTFFYPAEEYRSEHLEKLSQLCKKGFGETEIHLHHENDTPEGFKEKLLVYRNQLVKHSLLSRDNARLVRYGFIHGNWALNNSRRCGRFCGVNNELKILKETGCYADFTLPSAPSEAQTKKINSIYYAKDNPDKPKSHNTGVDVKVGRKPNGDLMIIQGPLTLNWKSRKWGIFPRIENGEISHKNPPTQYRVDLWIRQGIHIKKKPNWIFVKVYTHGAQENNTETLLGQPAEGMHSYLTKKYNDQKRYFLHYVTAREMFNIIKAAEDGLDGNPRDYRDYFLQKNG